MLTKRLLLKILKTKLNIKKIGENYTTLCPFHTEKTPSCSISLQKLLYHCFGCGASGTIFNLLNVKHKIYIHSKKKKKNKQNNNYFKQYKKQDLKIIAIFAEYLKYELFKNTKTTYVYLKNRQLTHFEFLMFSLGFANSNLNMFYLHKKHQVHFKNILYTHANRVIFPLKNIFNFVVGFSGRTTINTTPKYLHTKNTKLLQKKNLLYGLFAAKEYEKTNEFIFVVEGFFDVITLHSKKLYNTVATLGSTMSTQQTNLLATLSQKILLCYDNDPAGNKITKNSLVVLKSKKKFTHYVELPKSYDPDNFVKNYSIYFLFH